jgi:hypothetical protein
LDIENAADLAMLESIADAHAFEVWGNEIARGEPFPVADTNGDVRAYVFPYALATRTFPANLFLAARQAGLTARFGAIYVAARRTAQPVLRVVNALHPLFVGGEEAQMIGRSQLATADACLTRIYWLGLHQEYFEISAANRRVLLDVHTLRKVEPGTALQLSASEEVELAEPPLPMQAAIQPTDTAAAPAPTLNLVPLADSVPAVNWTWWCVPTAWTMATCYYDNFVKGTGGIVGYGRLVGHWFDHPKSKHNVPDFIDQIIDPQTGTWRTGFSGYPDFIQKTYGYAFATKDVTANAANDWAWPDIVAEINAGRPFVWGTPNHANCAFGYRIAFDGSKRVVIHTTWGDTPQSQREEWLYTQGEGLTAIIPSGSAPGQNLVLWTPDDGETLLTDVATSVRWYIWGEQIKTAKVSISADGGNTWQTIATAAPCVSGWNNYDWTPETVSDRVRVRIRGYNAAGAYIAGDGSQNNAKVLQGPPAWRYHKTVIRTHAKNNTQMAWAIIDGSGWLSVKYSSVDGVSNIFINLCEALANNRKVDVFIQDGQIAQATLH